MRRGLVVTIVVTLFTIATANYLRRDSKDASLPSAATSGLPHETRTTLGYSTNLENLENLAYGVPFEPDEGTDLHGNRIQSAVATYGVDASGGLYDTHAPQVDLPHLDRPST